MKIRQEKIEDYPEVYSLVRDSFATTSFSDGTESDYLNEIRKKDSFIPELSLVAENHDGRIIGQVVVYKTDIQMTDKNNTQLVLSPVCVHPEFFRRGIGSALIKEAFQIAKKLGYSAIFLCGSPDFYRKLGFRPTYEFDIFHVDDKARKADWCMVYELTRDALKGISGTINIE